MKKIRRNILLNPGPATTLDSVKYAQVVPDICPREQEFSKVMKKLSLDLLKILKADKKEFSSILFCGSGTICMDACLNSLTPESKKVLIINNGAYSKRAVEIAKFYHLDFINLEFSELELPDLDKIESVLKENNIGLVYTTHHETGTGLLNPIRKIGKLAHKYNAVFVVDSTSSFGMIELDLKKDNVDFCMSSAQKGLGAMSGLSFVIGKTSLIEESKNYKTRSYYCNIYLQYKYFKETSQMHFTPPVQTIYAASEAMKQYFKEGESKKFARHRAVFFELFNGFKKLGFRFSLNQNLSANLVLSIIYPDDKNWDFNKIHDYCFKRGFTIYPGKISNTDTFRVCAFGAINANDIKRFMKVFKAALIKNKVSIPAIYKEKK